MTTINTDRYLSPGRPGNGVWTVGRGRPMTRHLAGAMIFVAAATACGSSGDTPKGTTGGAGSAATTNVLSNTGAPSGQPPPASGTCRLVSETEVASAVGAEVKGVGAASKPEGQVCTFALTKVTDPPQTVLVVTATAKEGPEAFEAALKGAGVGVQTIGEVGDKAFVSGGQVVVLKGDTLLVIVVGLDQPASTLGQSARKLAETVVARL